MTMMTTNLPKYPTMKTFFTILLLTVLSFESRAQLTFSGKIEYERKSNVFKLWGDESWVENMKSQMKPFYIRYYNMTFNTHQSLYNQGREAETPKMTWGLPPGGDNEIHQDFDTKIVTAKKTLYEQTFLIRDTAQKRNWKISSEVRTIAGFKCRKAVTIICDSVYVVAFYTDDIPVSGGPEQMGGLPGMILELAVPRLYTTWVATKVDVVSVDGKDLIAPSKGKAITLAKLQSTVAQSLKDWGKWGKRNIWWMVI